MGAGVIVRCALYFADLCRLVGGKDLVYKDEYGDGVENALHTDALCMFVYAGGALILQVVAGGFWLRLARRFVSSNCYCCWCWVIPVASTGQFYCVACERLMEDERRGTIRRQAQTE